MRYMPGVSHFVDNTVQHSSLLLIVLVRYGRYLLPELIFQHKPVILYFTVSIPSYIVESTRREHWERPCANTTASKYHSTTGVSKHTVGAYPHCLLTRKEIDLNFTYMHLYYILLSWEIKYMYKAYNIHLIEQAHHRFWSIK